MDIRGVRIGGFGVWRDLELADLNPGMTVVLGANEAGKTTVLQFVRGVLFGFQHPIRRRYLDTLDGERLGRSSAGRGPVGGSLDVLHQDRKLRIERWCQDSAGGWHDPVVVREDGPDGPRTVQLADLLGSVDEATFENVFSCGLREIQELGTLDATQAADLLYKLSTGLDRVSLVDIDRDLHTACHELFDPAENRGRLLDAFESYREFQQETNRRQRTERKHLALHRELADLDAELAALKQQRNATQQTLESIDIACTVMPLWRQREALRDRLAATSPPAQVDQQTVARLAELRTRLRSLGTEIRSLRDQRQSLRDRAAGHTIRRQVWQLRHRIEAVGEHAPWLQSLEAQVAAHDQELAELTEKAAALRTSTASQELPSAEDLPEVNRETMAALRPVARAFKEQNQRMQAADERCAAARQALEQLHAELDSALSEQGHARLAPGVEEVGQRVSQLRRRVHLDQRLEEMDRQRKKTLVEHRRLMQRQVLAPTALAWLAIPFVIGAMLLAGGITWRETPWLGWPAIVLGMVCWSLAVITKIGMERSARRELARCEKQMELLHSQIKQARQERTVLDHQLSLDDGPWQLQLEQAERHLAKLEELLPVEADGQAARQRLEEAERQCAEAMAEAEKAEQNWRAALERLGLPTSLTPSAIKQLASDSEKVAQLRQQIQRIRQQRDLRLQEQSQQIGRIRQLLQLAGLTAEGDHWRTWLEQLAQAVAAQQVHVDQWRILRQEDRRIGRLGRKSVAQYQRLRAERRQLMTRVGVDTEREVRELVARYQQYVSWQEELAELEQQLHQAVDSGEDAMAVRQILDQSAEHPLEPLRESTRTQLRNLESQLEQGHQQRGELASRWQAVRQDRSLHRLRWQSETARLALQRHVHRWAVLATTNRCLDDVHQLYETQRQPETLNRTSQYFAAMSRGRYVRVWTPLTENSLRVMRSPDQPMTLETLSCGTREMLLLCLRLALVEDYARRGIRLPLLLDDPLVNLDAERAEAAANQIQQFAQAGHQVILFTCHQHIAELFAPAHVDMRYLSAPEPDHVAAVQPVVPAIDVPAVDVAEAAPRSQPPSDPTEPSADARDDAGDATDYVDDVDDVEADDDDELWDDEAEYEYEYVQDEDPPEADDELESDWDDESAEEDELEEEDVDDEENGVLDDASADENDVEYLIEGLEDENDEPGHADSQAVDYLIAHLEDEELTEVESPPADPVDEVDPGTLEADSVEDAPDAPPTSDNEPLERPPQQRFAWESPERWWDDPQGDRAA